MPIGVMILLLLLICTLLAVGYKFRRVGLHYLRGNHYDEISKNLRFLNVKMPRNEVGEDKNNDAIQNMKQNIEVMNQVYKNFYALAGGGRKYTFLGYKYVVCEMMVDKEMIYMNLAVPEDYTETFEKLISSFYPGAVIDQIPQPKLLEEGKYMHGGYITLRKENAMPIKTYDSFEVDPMDGILSSFARVGADEKLILQVVTQPLSSKRQKKMRGAVESLKKGSESGRNKFWTTFRGKEDEKKDEDNHDFSNQQIGDIEKKSEDEGFDVVMRVLATSPSEHRPDKIVDDLLRGLYQYNYVGLNAFEFSKTHDIQQFARDVVKRTFHTTFKRKHTFWGDKKNMILNIREISSIYHFPHVRFNKNPRIKRQNFKIVPAPDNMPADGIHLGYNLYGGVKKEIYLSDSDRFRHFYILGQTGTGKSTIMQTKIKQDMARGNGFTLIDPHGDLADNVLKYFPKERIDDLIYRDAGNMDLPFGFNFLTARNEREMDLVTNDAVDMFIKLYGADIFGPRIQDYFRNAVLLLMEQPDKGTLVEIVRLFTDEAYQKIKVKNVKNPVVRSRWDKTYGSMGDKEKQEMIPYFQSKFGPLITTPILRNIIGQPESSFDFGEAMDSGKIILMNLSKGLMGDLNANMLGMMVVSQIRLAAFRRADQAEHDRVPHFMYIDEFQNFVTPAIESILSEARKYKLGLILAHQYIKQIQPQGKNTTDLSAPIFGNIGNIMAYRIGVDDTDMMEKQFSPKFAANDLVNLDKFKAVIKMSVNMQPTPAFSLNVKLPWEDPDLNTAEKIAIIKQISALKYGRKKELVDKEIFYRVGA